MVNSMVEKAKQPATYVYKKDEGVQKRVGGYQESIKELTYEEKLKKLQKYEPVIPQAPVDMRFHYYKEDGSLGVRAKTKMIESIDELRAFAERAKGQIVGMDTETTGLSFYKDKIVGFSLALNDMEGYYVPIRHQVCTTIVKEVNKLDENGNIIYNKNGKPRKKSEKTYQYTPSPYNLPVREALDLMYEIMLNAKCSIWHNSEFDLNMIKAENVELFGGDYDPLQEADGRGYDITKCRTFDTNILPYIYDAEGRGIAGLKDLEKRLLGRYRPGFKETVGDDANFQYTDPSETQFYAAIDACSVLAIYKKLYPMTRDLVNKAPRILDIDGKKYDVISADNNLIRAFTDYYDHAKLKVDKEEAKRYRELVLTEKNKLYEEIFAFFGRGPFSLSTQSKEFKGVMSEWNIDTGAKTDKGAIAFGKKGIKEFNKNLTYLKNMVFPNVKYMKFNESKQFGSKLPKKDQQTRELNTIVYNLVNIIKLYGKDYCKWVDQVNNLVVKNKDGSMATRLDFYNILKSLYFGELKKLEVLKKIQQCSSLDKALNSYISKLTEVDECRLHYNLLRVASGRLSGGQNANSDKKKNKYYIDLNPQNLTKPKQVFYRGYKSDAPGNVLGYMFEHVSDDYAHEHIGKEIIVEAGAPNANIRKCFVAGEDEYVVAMDFCVSPETTVELQTGDVVPITYLENNPQYIKTPKGYELAYNFHYTGQRRKCILTLKSGKQIVCSPDHKFLVRDSYRNDTKYSKYENADVTGYNIDQGYKYKWLPLKDISVHNILVDTECPSGIYSIKFTDEYINMCDITVGDSHCYYADGILTHNCNQEARLLALLSQDPVMLNVFLTGEDMHTTTAVAIFGEKGHDKKYRKIAKSVNFALNYSGNEYTLANNLDIPVEEARQYVEAYNNRYSECIRWKKREVQKMYEQGGTVYSIFGRPRQFITRLRTAGTCGDEKISMKIQNAVERRVPNHEIQSACGDICRHILYKLYKKFFKHRDPNIDYALTCHDEVVYYANKEHVVDYVRELQDIMTFTELDLQFNLDTSTDLGLNYGQCFPFKWSDETRTRLVPDSDFTY